MQKTLRIVDNEKGIIQITTLDERWYAIPTLSDTGIPSYTFAPSATWIAGHYPKGVAFYKWLAQTGWDESQALKNAAGSRGHRVHAAIHDLSKGMTVRHTDKYQDDETGVESELTLDEWRAIVSWTAWANEAKPKFIAVEKTIYSREHGFAGTIDAVVEIDGVRYIVDWKTSKNIWTEYELQVSAYRTAWVDAVQTGKGDGYAGEYRAAILQVGYDRNRKGYKWTEVGDKFDLFMHARAIWENENPASKPKQIEMPTKVSINITD